MRGSRNQALAGALLVVAYTGLIASADGITKLLAGQYAAAQLYALSGAMEEALDRMRHLLGFTGDWTDLISYLPDGWHSDPVKRRSATAATFAASLQLVKEGKAELRQSETFAPIQLRSLNEDS